MPIQTTNIDNSGDGFDYTSAAETFMIMSGIAVVSEQEDGAGTSYNDDKLINYGALVGSQYGILDNYSIVNPAPANNVYINEASGLISANTAIKIETDNDTVLNYGHIQGLSYGIDAGAYALYTTVSNYGVIESSGTGAYILEYATLTNSGTIDGATCGIEMLAYGSQPITIVNSGVVESGGSGSGPAILGVGYGGEITIRNTGTIDGTLDLSHSYTATIINKGVIVGDVDFPTFSAGAPSSFDGRGGTVSGAISCGGGGGTFRLGADGETANGGAGNDVIYGGAGNDTLTGGAGVNYLDGGAGADELDGTGGTSYAVYSDSSDYVNVNLLIGSAAHGDAQGDTLVNIHRVIGSNFNDTLIADNAGDVLEGGGGNDALTGGSGNDSLFGGAGNDTLVGGAGADYLDGGAGADHLDGTGGTSTAAYTDATIGVTVNLLTPASNTGDAAGDVYTNIHRVTGSNFADNITGDNSGDVLNGGAGNDVIVGGSGLDTIYGGAGADTLTGGSGADHFNYNSASEGGDTITDFSSGDLILASHTGFGGGLVAGALPANRLANNAPNASFGQFIWTAASHTLSWDVDGTGAAAAVKIATLTGVTSLSASSILIF